MKMKKLLLLFITTAIFIFSSCEKDRNRPCSCMPPPTQFAFTLIDEDGKSAVKPNWVHNYRLYYLQGNTKMDLDMAYKDSLENGYKYKYLFFSSGAQALPDKGIHEFYINYGAEDTDTLWIDPKY